MNVTDEPLPGVAPTGSNVVHVLGHKGGDSALDVIYIGYADDEKQIESAKRIARQWVLDGHEVIVIVGNIVYRAWDRDKHVQDLEAIGEDRMGRPS